MIYNPTIFPKVYRKRNEIGQIIASGYKARSVNVGGKLKDVFTNISNVSVIPNDSDTKTLAIFSYNERFLLGYILDVTSGDDATLIDMLSAVKLYDTFIFPYNQGEDAEASLYADFASGNSWLINNIVKEPTVDLLDLGYSTDDLTVVQGTGYYHVGHTIST